MARYGGSSPLPGRLQRGQIMNRGCPNDPISHVFLKTFKSFFRFDFEGGRSPEHGTERDGDLNEAREISVAAYVGRLDGQQTDLRRGLH